MIMNAATFWKNRSMAGHVLLEICSICVDTELSIVWNRLHRHKPT